LATAVTLAVDGLMVIIKLCAVPEQPLAVGTIEMWAFVATLAVLITVNGKMFPVL
jgi:hypothetical protein